MMEYSVTDYILKKVPKDFWQKQHFVKAWNEWVKPDLNCEKVEFSLKSEATGGEKFGMISTGGVEVEVGEFLYALTRIVKPKKILETGTNLGISDLYFALALKKNSFGHLTTIEVNSFCYLRAQALFEAMEIDDCISLIRNRVEEWDPEERKFDIVFLDTEPSTRFDELVKFYPNVSEGGFILIHDLHSHLDCEDGNIGGGNFGDFRKKFGDLILNHYLQTMSFPTPRGLAMFQKTSPKFSCTKFLRGEI